MNVQPLEKGVILDFKIETDGNRRPQIVGNTNLPDGTELMFSIEGKSVKYNGDDKGTVQGGQFQSDKFGKDYGDLEPGQYLAEVVMPIAEVQSPAVQSVIGKQGENLKGSLVKKEGIGTTISLEKPFQLNADGKVALTLNKTEIASAEKNAFTVYQSLQRLENQGRSMESLRSKKTTDAIRECGILMRERQPVADDLRSKAESLPQPFSNLLTPAAIDLKLCVSCASFAIDNCNRAKTSLNEAAKEMKK